MPSAKNPLVSPKNVETNALLSYLKYAELLAYGVRYIGPMVVALAAALNSVMSNEKNKENPAVPAAAKASFIWAVSVESPPTFSAKASMPAAFANVMSSCHDVES